MTPAQQQKRRRELHTMADADLRKLYAKLSGRLVSEVTAARHDHQALVDLIVYLEKQR